MSKKLLILSVLSLCLFSCSKNDSSPKPDDKVINPNIESSWNLSSIEVGNLDFGLVNYNDQKLLTINILNDGDELLSGTITLTGADFSLVYNNCSDLAPLHKCQVKVGFDARGKTGNSFTGNLAYGEHINTISAYIDRNGQISNKTFTSNGVNISDFNFGTIEYRHNLLKTIVVKNTGGVVLNSEVSLTGSSAYKKVYDSCSNNDLKVDKNCIVKIFLSGQGQSGTANTILSYGDDNIPLIATVKDQQQLALENSNFIFMYNEIDYSNNAIDLQTINLNKSKEFRFVVKNIGTSAGLINSFNLDNYFTVFYNNCNNQLIGPNKSCFLRAIINPQAKGVFSTNIIADVDYRINSQSVQWTVRSAGDKIACTDQIEFAQLANITYDGSVYSLCQVEECIPTHRVINNACVKNVITCSVPNGSGTQTWNPSSNAYDDCVVDNCVSNRYELSNNQCQYIMPVAQNANHVLNEDTSLVDQSFNYTTTNPATIEIVSNVTHGTLTVSGNNYSYVPSLNYNGVDSFTYRIFDGEENSNTATVSISVTPVNDAPVANNQSVNTNEDIAANIILTGTDLDGNTLTYTVIASPSHGILTGTGANRVYTPNANYNGTDLFTFKVNDGTVDSNIATFSISVAPVNDAPVANNQSLTTNEDVALNISLTGSDTENYSITYTIVSPPTHGSLSGTVPNLVYTPESNYNGSDSFTFKVNDGSLDSNTATISLSITAVNDAPVANNQSLTTPEDTAKNITLTGSDVENSSLTYTVLASPAHGILSGTAPNLVYTPNANYNGTDSFTFKVNDGSLDSNVATISISVTSVNDAPVANNQSITTNEDVVKTGTLVASDIDADSLVYSVVAQGAKGTVTITNSATGAFTYTPNLNANGSDSFTFKVNDGTVNSNTATVSVTINPVNDAPIANIQSITTNEDTVKTGTLVATDVDADSLVYSVVSQGLKGVVSITNSATGAFTYTPNLNANGSDSFTFKVNDGTVDSNTATVSVTITAQNDAPVANAQSITTNEDTAANITLTATDDDGDVVTYVIVANPTNGVLTGSGANRVYTPNANYNGSDSFTFKVNDGTVDSNVATISLTVTPVNDIPVVNALSFSTPVNTLYNGVLSGTDVETAASSLVFSLVQQGTKGSTTVQSNGSFSYTPNANATGADSFKVRAFDGQAFSNDLIVSVTISTTRSCSDAQGFGTGSQTWNGSSWNSCVMASCPTGRIVSTDQSACVFINATGGTVSISGNYKIHKYITGPDNFVVQSVSSSNSVEYLIVGGGGGGGGSNGCAGGGGQVKNSTLAVSATSYSVGIGGGGAGLSNLVTGGATGGTGIASSFAGISSAGGGGGGEGSQACTGGASGSGNPGGSSPAGQVNGGGGGGGQSGAGAGYNTSNNSGGAGGFGLTSSITDVSLTYGCGGGGGAGNSGSSGGAAGCSTAGVGGTGMSNGGAGTANFGGGGGGGGGNSGVGNASGGSGGSGVVVIKYLYK